MVKEVLVVTLSDSEDEDVSPPQPPRVVPAVVREAEIPDRTPESTIPPPVLPPVTRQAVKPVPLWFDRFDHYWNSRLREAVINSEQELELLFKQVAEEFTGKEQEIAKNKNSASSATSIKKTKPLLPACKEYSHSDTSTTSKSDKRQHDPDHGDASASDATTREESHSHHPVLEDKKSELISRKQKDKSISSSKENQSSTHEPKQPVKEKSFKEKTQQSDSKAKEVPSETKADKPAKVPKSGVTSDVDKNKKHSKNATTLQSDVDGNAKTSNGEKKKKKKDKSNHLELRTQSVTDKNAKKMPALEEQLAKLMSGSGEVRKFEQCIGPGCEAAPICSPDWDQEFCSFRCCSNYVSTEYQKFVKKEKKKKLNALSAAKA